jgi:hypothetical protein
VTACSTCDRQEDDMSLEKLMDKYNPLKGIETQTVAALQSWKDSAAVIRLSEYLKQHKDRGIYLYQRNGRPYLYFNPGIVKEDRDIERWHIAFNMTVLFFEAVDDLEYLLNKGLIDIPLQALAMAKDDNRAV